MRDVRQIIKAVGGVTRLSVALSKPIGTVSAWQTRGSIPSEYWLEICALAPQGGSPSVTLEDLARCHAIEARRDVVVSKDLSSEQLPRAVSQAGA